jgi:hypothetical protein
MGVVEEQGREYSFMRALTRVALHTESSWHHPTPMRTEFARKFLAKYSNSQLLPKYSYMCFSGDYMRTDRKRNWQTDWF